MKSILLTLASLCFCISSAYAIDTAHNPQEPEPRSLRRVEAQHVCMSNDAFFEGDQVQVTIDNKNYYGCCNMCKDRLVSNPAMRNALDPVTGIKVDKATAVIGVDLSLIHI